MGEKRIRKNRVLCIGMVLAMLAGGFLAIVPGVRADENYDHTYTDPSGDVALDDEVVGGHDFIDITEISSTRNGDNIIFKMKVVGTITDGTITDPTTGYPLMGITYDFYLDTNGDAVYDYSIYYCDKRCTLYPVNDTSKNISDAASGSGTNTLTVIVSLSLLNNTTTLDFSTVAGYAYTAHYRDTIMKGGTGAGDGEDGGEDGTGAEPEKKKEEKGFIPGFETAFLLAAVCVSIVLLKKKRW